MYSLNKDFNSYISKLVKTGHWSFVPKGRRKHAALQHVSGCKVPIPGTPSGYCGRSLRNFQGMIRKTEKYII